MYAMDQTSHFEHRPDTARSRWELPRRRGAFASATPDTSTDRAATSSSNDRERTNDDYAD